MIRSLALLALLVLSTSYAVGCGEDVGPCNDPLEGRNTVLSNGTIEYAGQAIVNRSCARGCHSSDAVGAQRQGAPAGLDFDLHPVSEDDADGKRKSSDEIVKLSAAQLAGLRRRQNVVYQNRDLIWQQVREGLMPPGGMFAGFSSLKGIFETKESDPCKQGKQYTELAAKQETLRNWLACGAPIVESAGAVVKEREAPGAIGFQYPICEAAPGVAAGAPLAETPVTLEKLMKAQFNTCDDCHPGLGKPSFASLDIILEQVINSEAEVCDGKPYVKKGEPENSFLYDVLSKDDPGCNERRMPAFLAPLTKAQLKQVSDWIKAGAPVTDDDIKDEPMDGDEPGDEPGDVEPPDEVEPGDGEEPSRDAAMPAADGGRDAGSDGGRDAAVDAGRDSGRRRF